MEHSYLTNVISGQFRPSEKRCRELARVFGDDPNLILRLAGFYVQDEDREELKDFARYKSLKPEHKRLTRLFMEFLKWAEDSDLDMPESAGREELSMRDLGRREQRSAGPYSGRLVILSSFADI